MARRVDEVGVPVVGDGQSQTDRNGMVNVNLYLCANKRRAHIGGIRTNANSERVRKGRVLERSTQPSSISRAWFIVVELMFSIHVEGVPMMS